MQLLSAPIVLQDQEETIVAILRRQHEISRSDLAEITGFSRAKITGVVGGLVQQGVLQELGDGLSTGGRRPRILTFNGDFGYVLGIDIGATSVDLALADFNGDILERHSEAVDVRDGPVPVLNRVVECAQELLERREISPAKVYGVGIGVPGPVEFGQGILIAPPIMPGWEAYPIRAFIHETFPAATVMVDNDVNVMALGELRGGAGRRIENFIFVKVGTGIGAGIIIDGAIYRGANGCAGDIGHISADRHGPICNCGNSGCLEAIAAGPPIARRAMAAAQAGHSPILAKYLEANNGGLTAEDVSLAAGEGDPVANEIIQDSGRLIGEVLAGLVNFFNPSLILIGGGVSKIGGQFLPSIRRAVLERSTALSTRHLLVDYSTMGAEAGITGAVALALDHIFITAP